jgi:D-threo-aldose 1-dehydrogenase
VRSRRLPANEMMTRACTSTQGATGLANIAKSTSRVGFGTSGLLRIGTARERQAVLAAALACGITHFDTAPIYGFGESERALGRFLQRRRSEVTLTTKFGLQPSRFAARLLPLQRAARNALKVFPGLRGVAARRSAVLYSPPCFSVRAVRDSLEASLRALRTDYVDFYLAHQASVEALPPEEVIGLLEDLRQSGKIRAFGIATDFSCLMPVLERRPQLSRVVQFDSEPTSENVAAMASDTSQLVITYGFIARAVAASRERLRNAPAEAGGLEKADDDTLGGLLLRAVVLANPRGLVLMQSRSPGRIERNLEAANSPLQDDRVRRLVELLGTQR